MKQLFQAEVVVTPKPEVADPQGQAIETALARLKFEGCAGVQAAKVRVGKVFRMTLHAASAAEAEKALRILADKVLANPNIETFSCSLTPAGK